MISRIAFYPTLLYNVVMEKVTSRQWYNRIDDTVILGALPFRSMTKQLVENENVTGVITMNEAYETKYFVNSKEEWQRAGVEQLVLATPDLIAAPSIDNLKHGVDFLQHHREHGGSVYVHCKAGRTRSAALVACYLMQIHEWDPEKAMDFIKSKRPHVWLRDKQWNALRDFHDRLTKDIT